MAVPVIDIGSFISNSDSEAKKRCAKEVFNACKNTGFFLIKNYQSLMPQKVVDETFGLAQRLFELPIEEKASLSGGPFRGIHHLCLFRFSHL